MILRSSKHLKTSQRVPSNQLLLIRREKRRPRASSKSACSTKQSKRSSHRTIVLINLQACRAYKTSRLMCSWERLTTSKSTTSELSSWKNLRTTIDPMRTRARKTRLCSPSKTACQLARTYANRPCRTSSLT